MATGTSAGAMFAHVLSHMWLAHVPRDLQGMGYGLGRSSLPLLGPLVPQSPSDLPFGVGHYVGMAPPGVTKAALIVPILASEPRVNVAANVWVSSRSNDKLGVKQIMWSVCLNFIITFQIHSLN